VAPASCPLGGPCPLGDHPCSHLAHLAHPCQGVGQGTSSHLAHPCYRGAPCRQPPAAAAAAAAAAVAAAALAAAGATAAAAAGRGVGRAGGAGVAAAARAPSAAAAAAAAAGACAAAAAGLPWVLPGACLRTGGWRQTDQCHAGCPADKCVMQHTGTGRHIRGKFT
jgi:hypothetical protein